MIHNIISELLRLSFYGSFAAILILLVKRVFGKWFSAVTHYYLWLILLVRLLCPPITWTQNAALTAVVYEPESPEWVDDLAAATAAPISAEPDITAMQENTISIFYILCILYLLGLLIFLGIILYTLWREAKNRIDMDIPEQVMQLFHDECQNRQVRKCRLQIALCDSPYVSGIFTPIIHLPIELVDADIAQLSPVLAHELTHIAQGDFWIWKLISFFQTVHWFNPVLQYAFRKMREDAEFSCDYRVIRQISKKEQLQYGEALLSAAELSIQPDAHKMAFAKAQLHRRMERIVYFMPRASYPVLIVVLSVLFTLCVSVLAGFRHTENIRVPWRFQDDGFYLDVHADGNYQKIPMPEQDLKIILDEDVAKTIYADTSKIVVLYSNSDPRARIPLTLILSTDCGEHWRYPKLPQFYNSTSPPIPCSNTFNSIFMGFTSQKNGWIILQDPSFLYDLFILKTYDGGETWSAMSYSVPLEEASVNRLVDAIFVDDLRGYMCFALMDMPAAPVCFTNDGGNTWRILDFPFSLELGATCWTTDFQLEGSIGKIFMTVGNYQLYPITYQSIIWECDLSKPGSGATWVRHDFSQNTLQKHPPVLYSENGYQLTLPNSWTGRYILQTPKNKREFFTIYEGYNYCLPIFDDEHYGFLFSICAEPIAGSNTKQRYSQNVIGENDMYYFILNQSNDLTYADDETAKMYFERLYSDIPDIIEQFAQENHLKRNPNYSPLT